MYQSPIDITRENCLRFDPPPLKYWHYWNYSEPVTVLNIGNTVKLILDEDATNPPTVNGGHLDGSYELRHIEFRWGPQDYLGTEHTFNGKRFSMEAQLVHHKEDYRNSYETALKHKDGLVIISFFLQVACSAANTECNADNIGIKPLVTVLNKVPEPNSAICMKITQLLSLLETKATPAGYFTYPGSTTCPNYEEAVTWILYPSLIIVSHNQLEAFRNLKSMNGTPITGNYRDTQPLEGRTIQYC